MVNGKQMTITWHVNEFKTWHVDTDEVTKLIDGMKGIYVSHMKEYRGKKHDYLGMDLEFSVDREGRPKMMDYLKKITYDFPETIQGRLATPAEEHLLKVREDSNRKLLEGDRANTFHHSVAQLLFTIPCGRKDIQTAVALLTTRVMSPEKSN